MNITLNGQGRDVPDGASAAEVVGLLTTAASGIAVAVNGQVVRRAAWQSTALADGDRVEVLTAVQGG